MGLSMFRKNGLQNGLPVPFRCIHDELNFKKTHWCSRYLQAVQWCSLALLAATSKTVRYQVDCLGRLLAVKWLSRAGPLFNSCLDFVLPTLITH